MTAGSWTIGPTVCSQRFVLKTVWCAQVTVAVNGMNTMDSATSSRTNSLRMRLPWALRRARRSSLADSASRSA